MVSWFVTRFIELDGLTCLLNFLSKMDYDTLESAIHTSIIGCIKALMNNSTVINDLDKSTGKYREEVNLKTTIMSFVNAALKYGAGQEELMNALNQMKANLERETSALIDAKHQNDLLSNELTNVGVALLKYVPLAEEVSLLEEHKHEIDQMARADRFLYELSKITHYEQRLKALFYKKKFAERMAECKPKVEGCRPQVG